MGEEEGRKEGFLMGRANRCLRPNRFRVMTDGIGDGREDIVRATFLNRGFTGIRNFWNFLNEEMAG